MFFVIILKFTTSLYEWLIFTNQRTRKYQEGNSGRVKCSFLKNRTLLLVVCSQLAAYSQKDKNYKITSYQIWTLWQDTIWTQTESVKDCDYSCHVTYHTLVLWGKFVIGNEIYHVYSELERKEVDIDSYETTYYGTGKLVYKNKEIEVIYREKFFDLYAIRIEADDRQIVFQLEQKFSSEIYGILRYIALVM